MHDYIILLLLVLKSHPYKIMLSRFVSACHETELSIEPDSIHDDEKLSIGVIGSGPAGMAFAHTAAHPAATAAKCEGAAQRCWWLQWRLGRGGGDGPHGDAKDLGGRRGLPAESDGARGGGGRPSRPEGRGALARAGGGVLICLAAFTLTLRRAV